MKLPEGAVDQVVAYTLQEWRNRMAELAGGEVTKDSVLRLTFACPACHEVHSVREFYEAATARGDDMTDWDPTSAAQECFHRFVGDGKCDWCAYGLFRGPVIVTCPDGNKVGVFPFGEPEAEQ